MTLLFFLETLFFGNVKIFHIKLIKGLYNTNYFLYGKEKKGYKNLK